MAPGTQSTIRSSRYLTWAAIALVFAIAYRVYIHPSVSLIFGLNRVVQPIEDFPWSCDRIQHPAVEGCEHMWLDQEANKLYAACASINSRMGWSPGGHKYNASSRDGSNHLVVLNLDQISENDLPTPQVLDLKSNYAGQVETVGFDARRNGNRVRFWLTNLQPYMDQSTGKPLDGRKLGANATVEVFDLEDGSRALTHVKTIHSDNLVSPNSLIVDPDGVRFFATNDHTSQIPGLVPELSFLIGDGTVSSCQTDTGECQIVASKGFRFANGIVRDLDGLYFVANSASGVISIHRWTGDKLVQVDKIVMDIALDNLSLDADGNIIVAAFPDTFAFLKAMEDPFHRLAPATAFMIQKKKYGNHGNYEVTKIIEDRDAKYLPSSTIAVHDARKKHLFMSGILSPFITICKSR